MDVSVLFFGLFVGIFIFTLEGVVRQTIQIWKRTHSLNHAYIYMICVEAIVNLVFALTTRFVLDGIIPLSLGYYCGAVFLWAVQTQLLSQIIANRVALIMVSRGKARLLQWGLVVGIGVINIAVAGIWIPAHMSSASPFQVTLNFIFEYVEKSFFLLVDLGLNLYFLYLVRYRLIADGLSKYWTLYNFNIGFVAVSTIMDGLLLGLLSLPNQFAYVQFAPVTYIVKLYLELKMAQLIAMVVKRSMNHSDGYSGSGHQPANLPYSIRASAQTKPPITDDSYLPTSLEMTTNISGGHGKETKAGGIFKTITTVVQSESSTELVPAQAPESPVIDLN